MESKNQKVNKQVNKMRIISKVAIVVMLVATVLLISCTSEKLISPASQQEPDQAESVVQKVTNGASQVSIEVLEQELTQGLNDDFSELDELSELELELEDIENMIE